MAFNPFTSFRKHQKFWMAGAVLVCMMTFVLCSGGIRGTGLDDLLMNMFGRRHGEVMVQANGRKYYSDDLSELKNQRNIANDYIRELFKIGIQRLTSRVEELKASGEMDEQKRYLLTLGDTSLKDLFTKLNTDTRFFRGGTKLDDLVDFICWRDLANKYDVVVNDDVVYTFVQNACHGTLWGLDADTLLEAQYKIAPAHHGANNAAIAAALRQEYRVQLAQLAYIARWSPGPGGEREQFANIGPNKDGSYAHLYLNTPMQARVAPTPEQLGAQYRKLRTELTIDLLPVSLESLAAKVKLPDDPKTKIELLKKFYDDHARMQYNPNLDTPGFLFPGQAEIQFLAADAGMDYYRQPAKAVSALKKTPPIAYDPLSPLTAVLTWVAGPARWDTVLEYNLNAERRAYEKKLENQLRTLTALNDKYLSETDEKEKTTIKQVYEGVLNNPPQYKNSASPLTSPYYFSPGQYNLSLAKPTAAIVASLIATAPTGPLPTLAAYQEAAYAAQAKKIAPMAALARPQRILAGTEIFLARIPTFSIEGPLAAAGVAYSLGLKPQVLPVAGYLEEELQSAIEENLAQRWVNAAMLDVKAQLEAIKGRSEEAFNRQVAELEKKYSTEVTDKKDKKKTIQGLRFGETPILRNEYDIEYDDNLKPLRDSFDKYRVAVNQIEGRGGKQEMLREGDFHKIFFGTESLGVGPLEPYNPKIWPPYVTVPKWGETALAQKSLEQRLFDTAEKPIVFWKSVKVGSKPKEWNPSDPKMMEFVEKQYRLSQARANLMAEVKAISQEVKKAQQSEGKDLAQTMRELAKKHGTDVITLNKVANLVENPDRRPADPVTYGDYILPRGRVPFARPDMVKQLLSLRGLSAPLKIDVEEVDKSAKSAAAEAAAGRAKSELEELNTLNKGLFSPDIVSNPFAKVGQIQVLTNKPRDVYYIGTVTAFAEPSSYGYLLSDLFAQTGKEGLPFGFLDQVQQEFSKEVFRLASQRLRSLADVDITDQARKQFADDPQG